MTGCTTCQGSGFVVVRMAEAGQRAENCPDCNPGDPQRGFPQHVLDAAFGAVKVVDIHRAQTVRDETVEPVMIRIGTTIPDADVATTAQMFADEGKMLARALWESLPGGTIDQLVAELLEHRASLFRVRFPLPVAAERES